MTIFVLIGTFFDRCFIEDIFELGISAADTEFCEWVQFGIILHIPRHKYQVKPHSSPSFSVACRAAIAHRNHFFCLYEQNKRKLKSKQSTQPAFTCSKLTTETLEQGVKYVQS